MTITRPDPTAGSTRRPAPAGQVTAGQVTTGQVTTGQVTAHALRAVAGLVEHAGLAGLAVVVSSQDRVTIQVPAGRGTPPDRTAAVCRLATVLAITPRYEPGREGGWLVADGRLAGHEVNIFTPLDGPPAGPPPHDTARGDQQPGSACEGRS